MKKNEEIEKLKSASNSKMDESIESNNSKKLLNLTREQFKSEKEIEIANFKKNKPMNFKNNPDQLSDSSSDDSETPQPNQPKKSPEPLKKTSSDDTDSSEIEVEKKKIEKKAEKPKVNN